MRTFKKVMIGTVVPVLLVAVIVFGVCIGLSYNSNKTKAYGVLSLNYEEAYQGLYPNGTRFSIYDLTDDDILETVIKALGCEGSLTTDDIRSALTFDYVQQLPDSEDNDAYIATSYVVNADGKYFTDSAGISAEQLLGALFDVFKLEFYENYAEGAISKEIFDWEELDDLDYLDIIEWLNVKTDILLNNLEDLSDGSSLDENWTEGESYLSLKNAISSFTDVSLENLRAFVLSNKAFKYPIRYENILRYKKLKATLALEAASEGYSNCEDAINSYDASMITFVMIPVYDDTGAYMTRTKTGVDVLADEMLEYADEVNYYTEEISRINQCFNSINKYSVQKLDNLEDYDWFTVKIGWGYASDDILSEADLQLEQIKAEYESIVSRFNELVVSRSENKNDVVTTVSEMGDYELFGFERAIYITVAVCACLLIVLIVSNSSKKEESDDETV